MSHHDPTVVVLGAGFSSGAGLPLMAEFAKVVTEFATDSDAPLRAEERERFKRVLDYRWRMHRLYAYLNLDLDNLEHLFGLIDMEASLSPDDEDDPKTLREDLVFVLVKTLELTLRRDPGLESQINPYRIGGDRPTVREMRRKNNHPMFRYVDFARRLRPHDAVLTFNYDTVLEDALLAIGTGPDYGFTQPTWRQVERALPVLKLHGSANFVDRGERSIEIVDHELLEGTTDRYYELGTPLLIPPTWNKGSLTGVIQEIWTRADQALKKASRVEFIGYSLPETDLSFRYLLANSLAVNENLLSISVMDSSEETLQRYKGFLSEALRIQGKFREIGGQFPDNGHLALARS